MSILVAIFGFALHFLIGEEVSARRVVETMLPTVALNLLLAAPVFALCRRLLRPFALSDRTAEVQVG
jgi:hypothetical protein